MFKSDPTPEVEVYYDVLTDRELKPSSRSGLGKSSLVPVATTKTTKEKEQPQHKSASLNTIKKMKRAAGTGKAAKSKKPHIAPILESKPTALVEQTKTVHVIADEPNELVSTETASQSTHHVTIAHAAPTPVTQHHPLIRRPGAQAHPRFKPSFKPTTSSDK